MQLDGHTVYRSGNHVRAYHSEETTNFTPTCLDGVRESRTITNFSVFPLPPAVKEKMRWKEKERTKKFEKEHRS